MGTANNFMLQRSRNVRRLPLCAVKVWAPEEQQATGGGHKQGKKGVKHRRTLETGMCTNGQDKKKKPYVFVNNIIIDWPK